MREFWGRQVEIQKIEKKIMDFVESETPLEMNYIGYWGISGIGKSKLIEQSLASQHMADMDFLPVIRIDCSMVGKDIIRLYDQIVEKVESVTGTAVCQNYNRCRENNREMIKDIFRGFSGAAIPDIVETAAVTVLGPIGCGLKAIKYIPKAASYISSAGLEVIKDAEHDKNLEEMLSEALIKDFASIAEQKMVIIIDSLECIENEYYELPQNFFDKDGLFCRISNVLWIVLGQTQNEYLEELGPLEAEEYIEDFQALIKDGDDVEGQLEKIKNISKGIPYILQMVYEVFQEFPDELILDESYWEENWNPILSRLFMKYDNQTLKIVGILSVLRNWDDRLVNNLLLYLRFHNLLKWNIEKDDFTIYRSLKVLPFVKQKGSFFSFHDCVIDFYRRILSKDEKADIYRLETNYILQKYKRNNIAVDNPVEINLYLLTWLRDLREQENCDTLKSEIIAALYFILNKFLSYENIFEWKNVVYEIISMAILLEKPELDHNIIMCLLFDAYSVADTRKIECCYWLQAKFAENQEDELCKEIKLLKSQCVLARTKSSWKDSSLPFGIQYRIEYGKEQLCESIFERLRILDSSCEKTDYMIDCLAEYEYVYGSTVLQTEAFLKELIKTMEDLNLVKDTTLENIYRYIYFFESLNLVTYHHNDILRKELEPFFAAFIGFQESVPEQIRGEYYFQAGLYLFNRKLPSYHYFLLARKHKINNRYHKMWAERACANHFIRQEKISSEEFEILVDSLEYILEHAKEISRWNLGVYLSVYTSILIKGGKDDRVPEIIMYITECTPSAGCSLKDLDWYCLCNYYFEIVDYIIYKMKDYRIALKWIGSLIRTSGIRKKDKQYYLCRIVLLQYKILIQYQLDDAALSDTLNELMALLYTAEAVLGKNAPDILRAREWIKHIVK